MPCTVISEQSADNATACIVFLGITESDDGDVTVAYGMNERMFSVLHLDTKIARVPSTQASHFS